MKFKSIITSTLALGVLATTGATFINNEASASKQQSHSTYHKSHAKSQVQYTITLNGITSNILSYLALPKNTNVSYKDLTYKVKSVLKYDRGVSDIDVSNAKKASYTVFYKNGTKKVVDLKSNNYTANLVNTGDIKKIDINVDLKKHSKEKVKANTQVPYTIAVNGASTPLLANLTFSNKHLISYKDLNAKVKSVLKYDRGINEIDLKFAKKAKYTVHFKNGTKKVVDLKSDIFSGNLFRASDIKKIDINVDVKIASKDKAKVTTQVPYTIAVNGTSAPILSSIAFPNKELISNKDLNAKVKSVLKHDRGIRDLDIQFAKQAKYTVHFKNGTKRVIDLKSNVITGNLFKASDIKNIEINVKQHNHKGKDENIVTKVTIPVYLNGHPELLSHHFRFTHANRITFEDLNLKLKSTLANDQGVQQSDIDGAERIKYKVYFKDGTSEVIDLKAKVKNWKVFKATDIKKIDMDLKF
ncbi:protein MAP (pseudogene) [Staphylococcus argenteus]|nr:protein MAP (pseudogene) [Staphylococcus argenteus]